jgi:hypothetical protein
MTRTDGWPNQIAPNTDTGIAASKAQLGQCWNAQYPPILGFTKKDLHMLTPIYGTIARRPWLALTCLGAAALATPLTASAQTMSAPMTAAAPQTTAQPAAHPMARRTAYRMQRETLEQRIGTMHAALKITPAEEADWAKVADVMRRNDSDMQKLVADRQAQVPHELSAVDDLKTYQSFTQAHVDGLKDLLTSFETLYAAMPADQKTVADRVFAKYGSARVATHHAMQAHS